MKFDNVVSYKKSRTIGVRLTESEVEELNHFSNEIGIPLAELFRRLVFAAREYFYANDGWPREIAVIKKPRDGAEVPTPLRITPQHPEPESNTEREKASPFTATNAFAAKKTATKRKP